MSKVKNATPLRYRAILSRPRDNSEGISRYSGTTLLVREQGCPSGSGCCVAISIIRSTELTRSKRLHGVRMDHVTDKVGVPVSTSVIPWSLYRPDPSPTIL